MELLDRLFDIARRGDRKIVLPEGDDARIVAAAARLKSEKIARPILLGTADAVGKAAAGVSLDGIEIVDPRSDARLQAYGEALAAVRASMTSQIATRLVAKPLYFGGMMVRQGDAAAMVAGAANPTRRVIEAGLMTIGLAARHLAAVELFSHRCAGFSQKRAAAVHLCRLRGQCRSHR